MSVFKNKEFKEGDLVIIKIPLSKTEFQELEGVVKDSSNPQLCVVLIGSTPRRFPYRLLSLKTD